MDCGRRLAFDDDRSSGIIRLAVDDDRHRGRWAVDDARSRIAFYQAQAKESLVRSSHFPTVVNDYPLLELPLRWRDPPLKRPMRWRDPPPPQTTSPKSNPIVPLPLQHANNEPVPCDERDSAPGHQPEKKKNEKEQKQEKVEEENGNNSHQPEQQIEVVDGRFENQPRSQVEYDETHTSKRDNIIFYPVDTVINATSHEAHFIEACNGLHTLSIAEINTNDIEVCGKAVGSGIGNVFPVGVNMPYLNLADKADHLQCSPTARHNVNEVSDPKLVRPCIADDMGAGEEKLELFLADVDEKDPPNILTASDSFENQEDSIVGPSKLIA
ncbi:hypothetical protein MA16_Dca013759 [Dendrobium catenatum]|uniref:Uncharacterized protein n=1 Tax=Dendrobium catenatum TaxID=906689 RepID=A0A2I0VWG6_9ASPA|nr:hypothetical protein MA16_Dca013759 [Dendrobium catenatum]